MSESNNSGGYRMVVLYGQPADPDAFLDYYRRVHLPLAAGLPGLRRSEWGHGLRFMGGERPYFAIWQGDFDDAAAMKAAMASPAGQAVAADVANYATGGATIMHHAIEQT